MNKVVLLNLLFLVVVGCNNSEINYNSVSSGRLATPPSASVDIVPYYIPSSWNVVVPNDPSWDSTYKAAFIEACEVNSEFGEFITNSDTLWSYVDSEVRAELQNWTSNPYYYSIANFVANRMLWFQLLTGTYTDEQREAIQYYVNLALQYHNADGEMMSEALIVLHQDDFWSTARVASAADSASTFATEYLQSVDPSKCNCEDDSLYPSAYVNTIISAQAAKFALIGNSISVLDSLSGL